jgi:hypothetical protein
VLAAAIASSVAIALSSAAGVPVSCVADASWGSAFPAQLAAAHGIYDEVDRRISLRQVECERLQLLAGGARSSNVHRQYEFASALFLFAHEIAHSRGIDDEALADCAAGRSFLTVAARLGIGPGYARLLTDYLVNAHVPDRCYPS